MWYICATNALNTSEYANLKTSATKIYDVVCEQAELNLRNEVSFSGIFAKIY